MSWKLKVQVQRRGDRRPRWIELGPMSYFRARDEGLAHARAGRNARLVDPDGREGPLIMPPPASPAKPGALQLDLFSRTP